MLQALRDYGTRNVVVSNGESFYSFLSPIDFFKGTVSAVLTKKDVATGSRYELGTEYAKIQENGVVKKIKLNTPFSLISEKSTHIAILREELLGKIREKGYGLTKDEYELLDFMLKNNHILMKDRELALSWFHAGFMAL